MVDIDFRQNQQQITGSDHQTAAQSKPFMPGKEFLDFFSVKIDQTATQEERGTVKKTMARSKGRNNEFFCKEVNFTENIQNDRNRKTSQRMFFLTSSTIQKTGTTCKTGK